MVQDAASNHGVHTFAVKTLVDNDTLLVFVSCPNCVRHYHNTVGKKVSALLATIEALLHGEKIERNSK
jgi:hypothetical protein